MRCTLYLLWCFHRRLSRRPAQAGIIIMRADAEWPGTMSNHCKFTCFFFFSLTHRAFLIYCTPRQWRSRDFVIHSQRPSYQAVAQSGIHFTYLRCTVTLFGLLTFWSRGYFLKLNAKCEIIFCGSCSLYFPWKLIISVSTKSEKQVSQVWGYLVLHL